MRRVPIQPRSDKRVDEQAHRAAIGEPWQGTRCWLSLPGCVGVGDHWHELVGSGVGGSRVDPRNLCWTCFPCNQQVERRDDRYDRRLKVASYETVDGEGGLVPAQPHPLSLAEKWL